MARRGPRKRKAPRKGKAKRHANCSSSAAPLPNPLSPTLSEAMADLERMLGEYSDSEGSAIELPLQLQAGADDEAKPSKTSAASSPTSTPRDNFENSTVGLIKRCDSSTIETTQVESSSTSAADTMTSYAQPAHSASKPGVDAFDSVEWDPDLPSGVSPDKSPEPVPIKPKPVEYTTVGSLVNTKIVPQFTAPNRIQREGAQRKSLMSILHSYETGTLTNQQRGPPPPLNMANSMQYAQQIGRNPTSAPNTLRTTVPSSRRPVLPTGPALSDQEKEIFIRTFGPLDLKLENQPTSVLLQDHTFNVKELSEAEIEARLSASAGGALQGLDKMQTLHNLSKFKNPLQQFAKDRLEVFSAAKMHANRPAPAVPNIGMLDITNGNRSNTITNPSSHGAGKAVSNAAGKFNPSEPKPAPASVFSSFENFYNLNQRAQLSMADPHARNQGELDRNYEFPPGPPPSTNTHANPLHGAYSASAQPFSTPTVPPGYPKPLTAGPPGQRLFPANLSAQANSGNHQYAGTSSGQAGSSREQYYGMSSAQGDLTNQQYIRNASAQATPNGQQIPGYLSAQGNVTLEDFYGSQYGQSATSNFPAPSPWATKKSGFDHGVRTKIVDTISPEDAMKYYPNGLPPNMTGAWAPMSDQSKRQMKMLPPLTPQEEKAKKEEELNDRFDYGSRCYHGMTYDDYINELAQKQRNPFGPIAPPKKVEVKPVTVEEMNKMSLPDIAAPMVQAMFGTLTSYLDRGPDSRRTLSRWEERDEYYLDLSKNGNKSFFGEDWGRPQKRTESTESFPAFNSRHFERQ